PGLKTTRNLLLRFGLGQMDDLFSAATIHRTCSMWAVNHRPLLADRRQVEAGRAKSAGCRIPTLTLACQARAHLRDPGFLGLDETIDLAATHPSGCGDHQGAIALDAQLDAPGAGVMAETVVHADLLVCWFAGLLVCWFAGLLVCWFAGLRAIL